MKYTLIISLAVYMSISIQVAAQYQSDSDIVYHVTNINLCTKLKQNDLAREGLKGNVRELVTHTNTKQTVNMLIAPAIKWRVTSEYDTTGMLTEQKTSYQDSNLISATQKRVFNAHHDLVSEVFYNADSTYYSETTYDYDSSGHLYASQIHRFDVGLGYENSVWKYDSRGRCTEQSKPGEKKQIKYNEHNDPIETIREYGNDMSNVDTVLYRYDEHCQLIESDRTGYITSMTTYQYNDKGQVTQILENQYSEDKQKITEYQYDIHGNVSEEKVTFINRIQSPVLLRKYEYQYDSNDNWIRKTIILSGAIYGYEDREITYY